MTTKLCDLSLFENPFIFFSMLYEGEKPSVHRCVIKKMKKNIIKPPRPGIASGSYEKKCWSDRKDERMKSNPRLRENQRDKRFALQRS